MVLLNTAFSSASKESLFKNTLAVPRTRPSIGPSDIISVTDIVCSVLFTTALLIISFSEEYTLLSSALIDCCGISLLPKKPQSRTLL